MAAQSIPERWEAVMRRRLPELQAMMKTDPSGDVSAAIDLHAYQYGMPLAMEYARLAAEELPAALPGASYEKLLADKANLDQETYVNIMSHKVPFLRHLAYARAIAYGTWDLALLRNALEAFEATFAFLKPGAWHVSDQWKFHSAAVIALVAGDYARASALLSSKRGWETTKVYHDLLKRLAKDIVTHGGRLPPGSRGAEAFQHLFDAFRQPEFGSVDAVLGPASVDDVSTRRFEFALVKERYVTGNTGTPDWQRVFESISAAA